MPSKALISLILFGLMAFAAGCGGQNRILGSGSSASTGSSSGGGSGSTTTPMTYVSTAQTMNATTTAKTLTWDLVTQLTGTSPVAGSPDPKFSLAVQIVTSSTGQTAYQFSNPTVFGGSTALEVQGIGIMINGVQISTATTYSTLDRFTPASPSSRVLSPTNMVYTGPLAASDTLQITFGLIAPTTFAPPTYTQLKATTGVFGMYCTSCHSSTNAQDGLNLTSYTYLIENNEAVPYDTTDSKIYIQTMSGGMPENASPLTAAQEQQIHDWIMDGAPNN